MLIPRQPRQLSIYDISRNIICELNPWIQSINYIIALAIFVTYSFYDFEANSILNDEYQKHIGNDLHSKYGYDSLTACLNIPYTFPYLKDKILGPDHQIISCNHNEPSNSWQIHWCALHDKLVVLAWLSIFVKGLFLTWLKERKERSSKLKNDVFPEKPKDSIKNNISNNEKKANDVKIA
ncbi:19755_t:CDS:2, partial [Dentiscutata erythropus]